MTNQNQPFAILKLVLREAHPSIQVLAVIIAMFVSLLITSFICILLAIPLFHLAISDLPGMLTGTLLSENTAFLKYLQTCQSLGLFVLPSIILVYLLYDKSEIVLITLPIPKGKVTALVFLCLVLSSPLISLLIEWNSAFRFPSALAGFETKLQALEQQAAELTGVLLSGRRPIDLFVNMVMIAVIPAIGEEFIFRGLFQRIFQKWFTNYHLAIALAALVFSAFHMQFYGLLPRLVLGIFFGYLFYWSGNIWVPVLAHFFNNAVAVILDYFSKSAWGTDFNSVDKILTQHISGIIASVLLSGVCIYYLRIWLRKRS